MTYSESKFRIFLRKLMPKAYITKVPDKRQGAVGRTGMPDYISINSGDTTWWEVKKSNSKNVFNLNIISETQYITLNAMHAAGAKIIIAIYFGKKMCLVPYADIWIAKFAAHYKSIPIKTLEQVELRLGVA